MVVKILAFGTSWWRRSGSDPMLPQSSKRHTAYFNSTGVLCGTKVRRHWIVPGLVRFNAAGMLDARFPGSCTGQNVSCSEISNCWGGNRFVCYQKASRFVSPDCYLAVLNARSHGLINFCSGGWKSADALVIAASQLHERQEVMLLMKSRSWVRTTLGLWRLKLEPHGGSNLILEHSSTSSVRL